MLKLRAFSRFVKLEHTLFSLPLLFAGAGMSLAEKTASWASLFPWNAFLMLMAGFGARTYALAINRIFDRAFDAANPRTQNRELPKQSLNLAQAWGIALLGVLLYAYAAWSLGGWCLKLSAVPLLAFTLYPWLKRFTAWAHLGVGLSLSLAPLGGYLGAGDQFPARPGPYLLAGFTFFWVSGFDMLYALQDLAFDRQNGLHSVPAAFGEKRTALIAGAFHAAAGLCLVLLALGPLAGFWVWPALLPCLLLLAQEQRLGCSLEPGSAFFAVNAWMGFAVLLFVGVGLWAR
jgi:4-hydroxybenzoate polyprenyltransferase